MWVSIKFWINLYGNNRARSRKLHLRQDGLLTCAGNFTIYRNAGNGLSEAVAGGSLSLSRTFNGYGEVDAQDYSIGGQDITSLNLARDNNGRIANKTETINGTTSGYVYT